jgi:hypothetical protein
MFERLLTLFLHAKSGVIATVFLVGTTGALVTATVENGVTTITITEASPSPSASASASPSASASATASPTSSATASPTASPTGSPTASPSSSPSSPSDCKSKDQAAESATRTVDKAFSQYHSDLMHLRELNKGDAAKTTVENADKLLKQLRQGAVKAIHAATSCFKHDEDKAGKHDDEDENDNEDEDNDSSEHNGTVVVVVVTTSPSPSPTTSPTASPTTLTGTDPKTIADQAVAAMKLVFDTAKAQLPVQSASPKPSHSPRPSFTANPDRGDKHDGKGQKDDD